MLGDHIRSDSEACHSTRRETILSKSVYPCEKCGKQFESKDLMMTHLETHTDTKARTKTKRHVDKPSEFQCNLCSRKFTQFKNYDRHKRQAYGHDETQGMCVPTVARVSVQTDCWRGIWVHPTLCPVLPVMRLSQLNGLLIITLRKESPSPVLIVRRYFATKRHFLSTWDIRIRSMLRYDLIYSS